MSDNTQKMIDRICDYRGLPKIKKGAACEVSGKAGIVCGGNSSANLNVKFSEGIRNCHPYWKMKIFNDDGSVLYESPEEIKP